MKQYVGHGYTIYVHTNIVNGKKYIGQTKAEDLTRRWTGGNGYRETPHFNRAIKKYGWSGFTHEIIETGLTKEEADKKEIFYIALYKTTDPKYGYNICYGGHHGNAMSAEAKERLHQMFSGCNSPVAKAVDIYGTDGKYITTKATVGEAAQYVGTTISSMSGHCSKRTGTLKGYICHYHDETKAKQMLTPEEIYKYREQRGHCKPVTQYSLKGEKISEYKSIREAALATGTLHTEITACIKDVNRLSANRYMWRQGVESPDKIDACKYQVTERAKDIKSKAVLKTDKATGNIVRYASLKEAAEAEKVTSTTIMRWAKKKARANGLYEWTYENT